MKYSIMNQSGFICYSARVLFLVTMLISTITFSEGNENSECIEWAENNICNEWAGNNEWIEDGECNESNQQDSEEFTEEDDYEYGEDENKCGAPINAKYLPVVYSGAAITMGAYSTIFGNTQSVAATTLGQAAEVRGSILAGAAVTVERAGVVTGDLKAGEAATLGATALVIGNLSAEAAVFIGAESEVSGDLISGSDAELGALTKVGGNAIAATSLTLGAYVQIGKDELEGNVRAVTGPIVLGKNASVKGKAKAGTIISFGMNATVGGEQQEFVDSTGFTNEAKGAVATKKDELTQKQKVLADRVSPAYNELDTTIAVSRNLDSGVYHASALSTTAGITLTLVGSISDEPEEWLINIDTYISFGAHLTIELDENVAPGSTIIFNSGSYTTIGANSILVGTLFAGSYITTGENTAITGVLGDCGGMFATNGAITMGAHSTFGELGCWQAEQQGEELIEGDEDQGPVDGGYFSFIPYDG